MVAMEFWRSPATAWLAWFVSTALAVGVAWVGLRPVLDTAVPDRDAPLSAADVRRLAVPSAAVQPRPPEPDGTSDSRRSPGPTSLAGPVRPSSSRPSGSPGQSAGAPGSSSSPVVVDGWTRTTLSDGTPSYLRSFQVTGGSTVIRIVPGRVHLVSATPSPNYSVQTTQSDPTRLVVQFTGSGRYDIVDAMWWNENPYAQVSEVG
jgi:hypothetical protein